MDCTKEDTRWISTYVWSWSELQWACCPWMGCLRPGSFVWGPSRWKNCFGQLLERIIWHHWLQPNPRRGILELEDPHITSNNKDTSENLSSGSVAATQNLSLAGWCWCRTLTEWWSSSVLTSQVTWRKSRCGIPALLSSSSYKIVWLLIIHQKPGRDKGNLPLSPPLNKLKLVYWNPEGDPEEIQM